MGTDFQRRCGLERRHCPRRLRGGCRRRCSQRLDRPAAAGHSMHRIPWRLRCLFYCIRWPLKATGNPFSGCLCRSAPHLPRSLRNDTRAAFTVHSCSGTTVRNFAYLHLLCLKPSAHTHITICSCLIARDRPSLLLWALLLLPCTAGDADFDIGPGGRAQCRPSNEGLLQTAHRRASGIWRARLWGWTEEVELKGGGGSQEQ